MHDAADGPAPDLEAMLDQARRFEREGQPARAAWRLAEAVDSVPGRDEPRAELVRLQCARIDAGAPPPRGEIEEALALALLLEEGGAPPARPPNAAQVLANALRGP